jgi:diguanylate cyclase
MLQHDTILMAFELWVPHVPPAMSLAIVAALGYLIGRRGRRGLAAQEEQSRRELRRAQIVAEELEKIAMAVRQQLSQHQVSLKRFQDRVTKLQGAEAQISWQGLCREAEDVIEPTLRLSHELAEAYDRIRQQAGSLMSFTEMRTDALTGVSNRRALDESLITHAGMLRRYGADFSVAIFDIDHFKRVNDECGHLQGDRILQQVASLLDETARETDVVTRYGGEEFVVVIPQTDLNGAQRFAERARTRIAERTQVTVSAGVAQALPQETPEDLLARADKALYAAKKAGRDCTFRHTGEDVASDAPTAAAVGT